MREFKLWTKQDEDFIRDNYTELSDHEIAEKLERTFKSAKEKRMRLGCFRYFQENSSPIKGERWTILYDKYEVSNKGRVRKGLNKFLAIHVHKTGYANVSILGKLKYLHRIVWEAFNGEVPEGLEIDHKDCNKLNNSLYNLELVTHSENMRRACKNGCFKNHFGR